MGRMYVVVFPLRTTFSSTFLTRPSSPWNTRFTIPMGQSFLAHALSFMRTTVPTVKFWVSDFHFLRGCRLCKYSDLHFCQNFSASTWTCFHLLLNMSFRPKSGIGKVAGKNSGSAIRRVSRGKANQGRRIL